MSERLSLRRRGVLLRRIKPVKGKSSSLGVRGRPRGAPGLTLFARGPGYLLVTVARGDQVLGD